MNGRYRSWHLGMISPVTIYHSWTVCQKDFRNQSRSSRLISHSVLSCPIIFISSQTTISLMPLMLSVVMHNAATMNVVAPFWLRHSLRMLQQGIRLFCWMSDCYVIEAVWNNAETFGITVYQHSALLHWLLSVVYAGCLIFLLVCWVSLNSVIILKV